MLRRTGLKIKKKNITLELVRIGNSEIFSENCNSFFNQLIAYSQQNLKNNEKKKKTLIS